MQGLYNRKIEIKCLKCGHVSKSVEEHEMHKCIPSSAYDVIKEYAKKIRLFLDNNWLIKATVAILGIIAGIIAILQFLKLDSTALDLIKSLLSRFGIS